MQSRKISGRSMSHALPEKKNPGIYTQPHNGSISLMIAAAVLVITFLT